MKNYVEGKGGILSGKGKEENKKDWTRYFHGEITSIGTCSNDKRIIP